MKKLFLALSLVLPLFLISCNSMFENYNQKGTLVIKLPQNSGYKNRNVVNPGYTTDEGLYYKVTLTNPDLPKNPWKPIIIGPNTTEKVAVFRNVTPGAYDITCSVALDEKHTNVIAYFSNSISYNPERATSVRVTPTLNTVKNNDGSSNIVDGYGNLNINIIKGPTKSTYELGEEVDFTGTLFSVLLNNGYYFEVPYEDINEVLGMKFELQLVNEYGNGGFTTAERGCWNMNCNVYMNTPTAIDYNLFFPDAIKINAKKPVITKQPVSQYCFNTHEFSFSVEVETDPNHYGDISYLWFALNESQNSTVDLNNAFEDDSYRTANYRDKGPIYSQQWGSGNNVRYSYITCMVTNSDGNGINGETLVSTESVRAVLELWDPVNGNTATNQNYEIVQDKTSIHYIPYFFVNDLDSLPKSSDFYLRKALQPYSYKGTDREIYYINYYDYDSFNISVSPTVDMERTAGYIPYDVSYQYDYYEGYIHEARDPNDPNSFPYLTYKEPVVVEKTDNVRILTKFNKIPNTEYTLSHPSGNSTLPVRFYNPEGNSDDYKWYFADGSEVYRWTLGYSYDLRDVWANTVAAIGSNYLFYEDSNPNLNPVQRDLYGPTKYFAIIVINDEAPIKVEIERNKYILEEQYLKRLETEGTVIKVYLEVTFEVFPHMKNYVIDPSPVTVRTDEYITFMNYADKDKF